MIQSHLNSEMEHQIIIYILRRLIHYASTIVQTTRAAVKHFSPLINIF